MTADPRIAQADACYEAHDWAGALALYMALVGVDPVAPLAAYHCGAELSDRAVLDRLTPPPGGPPSERLNRVLAWMLVRAVGLCRTGDFARAAVLLRGVAPSEPVVGEVYRADIDAPATPAPTGRPGFLSDRIASLDPARIQARFQGRRLLMVAPRVFGTQAARAHEPIDNMMLAAMRFGLDYHELDTVPFGGDMAVLAGALAGAIAESRPDLILLENQAGVGILQRPDREPVMDVLRQARTRGVRVAVTHPDAWTLDDARLHAGLGDVVDVVHHLHPSRLATTPPAARDRVFCYPFPFLRPTAKLPADSIARYSFVGSVATYNLLRVIWWAELGRRGAPVDFFETQHAAAVQRTDQEFVELLVSYRGAVNFNRRRTGVRILTARSLEILVAGGLLIEEANDDARYFLEPGTHYVEFATLADLLGLIEALDRDPPRRVAVRAAGQAWARRWFSGDYFWAGLLDRAFG